ncbi:uncharacterized protein LOC110723805 [Chenopodium quinoa]|uniref:uncharacterized protein LOC110723805 n=1 Tax=Chenopodium quinoa TaxID=63459 RepID=UPI000B770D15|nr:uncharacterized protein LOC110723805 [Chenopodium quinoa]
METLMEEREATMISPSGGKPSFRIAHFLKPSFPISQQQQKHLNPPPISTPTKPISQIAKSLSYKINFNGWKNPAKNWSNWVDKLLPKFQSTWKNTSIYEPIMGSKYEIPRFRDSLFSICEKWCPENNTFVFNWGEVTITLEDIMVLGGYSVTGDSVLSKISSSELQEVKRNLEVVYSELNNSKSRKVSHYQWMDVWMKNGSEFEHEAFLTLWLSRYVLPSQADGVINKGVLPIAILLARGTKFALAPAVLASIYKDLRLLKEKIVWLRELGDQVDGGSVSRLCLSSPLQLLQVWIWERFTTLSPKPNYVTDGMSRLQKWHKVANPKNDDVGLAFDAAKESFRWRPYTTNLNNGSGCGKMYVEEAGWVSVSSDVSIDLESYVRILRNSKLVGLNCVEQYLPHRVSMQFGFDQDIPCVFPRVSDSLNLAWNDYNRPVGDVKLYIPSRLFESDVTMSYLEWWKDLKDVKDHVYSVKREKDAETTTKPISLSVPPGFSPKSEGVAMSDCFDQLEPCSKRSRVTPWCPQTVIEISESESSGFSLSLSSHSKGMKSDEEPDDDHLTLTELFGVQSTQKESRRETLSVNRQESPQSSAVDNALIQEITPAKETSENSLPSLESSREELIVEEKNESKVECQVTTPISTEVNKAQTSFNGTPECPDSSETPKMDILDRIAWVQKIFDIYKSAKLGSLESRVKSE